MPVVPIFDPTTGASGGASGGGALDIVAPADTSDSKAAGVGLVNQTFGAFTGTDAGLITGYAASNKSATGAAS